MRENSGYMKTFGVPILILIAIIGIISNIPNFIEHTHTVTVTDKERIALNSSGYYLIFCEDKQGNYYEFKDEDIFIRGKFDSSRMYNMIKPNKTYKFTVVGFRFPLFSWYQNIINVEEIGTGG